MFSFHQMSRSVNTAAERVEVGEEGTKSEAWWLVRRAYYLPQGPWLKRSSFRRLPTKHSWRKSCAPHNNTTAPGHPHTGNLRSLPLFHRIQTHSCCQPRVPTTYWRPGRKTHIQNWDYELSHLWPRSTWEQCARQVPFTPKQRQLQLPLEGLTCNTDVMFFNQSEQLNAGYGCIV